MYLQLVANACCSVIILFLIVVKKYQKEVKQLQQELAKRREMLHAKDMIISDLKWENSQMQNKRETMHKLSTCVVQCVLKVIIIIIIIM